MNTNEVKNWWNSPLAKDVTELVGGKEAAAVMRDLAPQVNDLGAIKALTPEATKVLFADHKQEILAKTQELASFTDMTTSDYVVSLVAGDGGDAERWQKAYHALINSENLKEKGVQVRSNDPSSDEVVLLSVIAQVMVDAQVVWHAITINIITKMTLKLKEEWDATPF